ncbi:Type II/IV secretion system ATP hydrolase TadA/VirB11/CpaF, TadA subfamily [Candidatus Syntrophocurvum alkaliphilum]|uniref:Type II/IV secretion system ATP hydrolase TadA/VirB11/CpaF, TadA subfamily n=1 Tax=Candidatus Syntrophocurvum alkaliphilum TaxID=2293317 RepID=A0A6I6DBL7_9FIRM|nr:CpaF family protein [Candidatus Syntrophocurvum alkaliphilum]QGU00109.1 Type II/IV secretion system ATP hydrolase TadA/VirB11/CpaF, TadA subfamily [Candidatus Syntrophocurvum alkaliphilum]
MSLLSRLQNQNTTLQQSSKNNKKEISIRKHYDLIHKIHREVVNDIDSDFFNIKDEEVDRQKAEEEVKKIAELCIEKEQGHFTRQEKEEIIDHVLNEVFEFGPITPLLKDESISEVMVNGPKDVYVEKNGQLEKTNVIFRDNDHLYTVIERIISPLGRRIDESSPMVDARLPDGSRVNAIIPPLALNGCVLTIRKFSSKLLKAEDLIRGNTMTSSMAKFLEACVEGRLNIVVSGGTGAGKTSTLNIISSFIPKNERIVTIEDAAELDLHQDHVISLETRPANIDNKGEINIRDLVRNSLRMRPDRLVVGEVRGGEALDMLQAMNTGHDGSLTTGHSNSPRDMISRLETMVLMAGIELPVKAIREQIAAAIDIIVHQSRLQDGSRKITHITEVIGMEGDIITLQDIFLFEKTGIDEKGRVRGKHRPTGIKPKCVDQLNAAGINLSMDFFNPDVDKLA